MGKFPKRVLRPRDAQGAEREIVVYEGSGADYYYDPQGRVKVGRGEILNYGYDTNGNYGYFDYGLGKFIQQKNE